MKIFASCVFVLLLVYCKKPCNESEFDSLVSNSIQSRFDYVEKDVWNRLEGEFYNRLKKMNLFNPRTDSLEAIVLLYQQIESMGFQEDFFLNRDDSEIKNLLADIEQVGLRADDESAQTFLFKTINPIYHECKKKVEKPFNPANLLVAYTSTDPDSVGINHRIALIEIVKYINKEDLENPGLYKTVLIFYFSVMMNKPVLNS